MRFYKLASGQNEEPWYQEWQEYNPFRWEIRLFGKYGVII